MGGIGPEGVCGESTAGHGERCGAKGESVEDLHQNMEERQSIRDETREHGSHSQNQLENHSTKKIKGPGVIPFVSLNNQHIKTMCWEGAQHCVWPRRQSQR